jgi:1-acyl-sn-glycerol-3-phosphate acyltransferase
VPRLARRLILTPLQVAGVLALLALSPGVLVVAALLSLAADRRRWRPLLGVAVVAGYLVCDLLAVAAALGLWLRSLAGEPIGGERMQRLHYALVGALLGRFGAVAQRLLRLSVAVEGEADAEASLRACRRPVIVLSRHAGPGDPLVLVRELMGRGRRPGIVLREAMRVDPAVDVLGSRIPLCFLRRNADWTDTRRRISALSARMSPQGALLLFPEGGNISDERRRIGIARLLRQGLRRRARQAGRLAHLAAPHPGGVLAALAGNPGADVVFAAHSGLAGMSPILWRRIPVGCDLRLHLWLVPAEEVPVSQRARVDWLFGWWRVMDDWVESARSVALVGVANPARATTRAAFARGRAGRPRSTSPPAPGRSGPGPHDLAGARSSASGGSSSVTGDGKEAGEEGRSGPG